MDWIAIAKGIIYIDIVPFSSNSSTITILDTAFKALQIKILASIVFN